MQKFRKLIVWKKAMEFISHIYAITNSYPKHELYGLTDQIRRAAVSIALNIAEGVGAGGDKEFKRFLRISFRSVYEVITGVEVAILLRYGKEEENRALLIESDELCAMLTGLMKSLKTDD